MSETGNVRFEDWEARQMQDPEFRVACKKRELCYQATLARLKKRAKRREGARSFVYSLLHWRKQRLEITFCLDDVFLLWPYIFYSHIPEPEGQQYFGYVRGWTLNWLWFEVEVMQPWRGEK